MFCAIVAQPHYCIMNSSNSNLYEMLFPDHDDDDANTEDVGLLRINEIFNVPFTDICKFFELESYNNSFSTDDDSSLNIMHFNIRNLVTNKTELEECISLLKRKPDIIALSETWLDRFNKTSINFQGYTCYNVVRTKPHGGVSILIRENIESSLIEKYSYVNSEIEICTVSVKIKAENYIVSSIYRPRFKHDKINEFRKSLEPILNDKIFRNSKVILAGDFNINLLEHQSHIDTNDYLAFMQNCNYLPVITRPTRYPEGQQRAQPSLLDHIYINFTPPSISGILKFSITDHLPTFLTFILPSSKITSQTIKFRVFKEENRRKFTRELSHIMWEDILTSPNIDTNFDSFMEHFQRLYNSNFPIVTKSLSSKRLSHPWITPSVIKAIKNKNDALNNFKMGVTSWDEYKIIRNRTNSIIKTSKSNYYINLSNNFKSSTQKLWQNLNALNKSPPSTSKTPNILHNNSLLTKPVPIADVFNNFFANIGSTLESKLPPPQNDPIDYLHGNFPNSMQVPEVTLEDVMKVIKSLKNKKCNLDDFAPCIIKENVHLLSLPISILFNQSVNSGRFPKSLKFARIIPLHKKGPKTDINNYRPISLLNIFSKIFEKLMKVHLISFIKKNDILSNMQYGFQQGRSTIDALIKFSSEIYEQLDKSKFLLSIFVDFSKAFDTVPHDLLLRKLNFYGIRGIINQWFADYLADRRHVTIIDGHKSSATNVLMGVPQGSVLGPILFLLFVNDLPNFSELLTSILFADDANLYIKGDDPSNLILTANVESFKLYNWCLANRISINSLKTFYLMFGNIPPKNLPPLTIKSGSSYELISRAKNVKFLGIYYEENMSFKSHINHLVQRLSRTSALIYQLKDFVPTFVLKTIYNAHVASLLNYCNIIWSGACQTTLLPLIRITKRIIRNIFHSDFLAHANPLFREQKILNVELLRQYNLALYFIKYRIYEANELQRNHRYPTRNRDDLRAPEYHTRVFRQSFLYMSVKVFNELRESALVDLNSIYTIRTLKLRLKKYFLSKL